MGVEDRRCQGRALTFALVLMLALFSSSVATAQDQNLPLPAPPEPIGQPGHFGAGIGGGTLSNGITAKYYIGQRHAVQGFVGLWGFRVLSPTLGLDYVQELGPLIDIEAGHLVWSIGGGVGTIFRIGEGDDFFHFGISAVTGPVWQFKLMPIEVALDVRPSLVFGDEYGGVYVGVGGALRWYFF
jgi:hypothetical protein